MQTHNFPQGVEAGFGVEIHPERRPVFHQLAPAFGSLPHGCKVTGVDGHLEVRLGTRRKVNKDAIHVNIESGCHRLGAFCGGIKGHLVGLVIVLFTQIL